MDEEDCIGQRVAIFWPNEEDWFEGTIAAFDYERGYRVEYDDGDEECIRSLDSSHVRRVGNNAATLPRELTATPEDTHDWGEMAQAGEDMLEGSEVGLGLSTDNFSPLPVPRVDALHRIVERRVNEQSSTIFEEDGDDRSQPLDTQDDYAKLELLDLATDVLMGHGGHRKNEKEEESDEEPLAGEDLAGEEVAILDGEVLGASDLPCSSRCVARVLYAESSGANVLFACKTTVHQTEPSASEDCANPEWARGGFRFELLAPIPGDPITGELIFAVLEAPLNTQGGGTRFLGQAVINLASAAGRHGGGEGTIDDTFPLRDRKGDLLSSGSIRLRLHVVLPLPRGGPPLAKRPSAHARTSPAAHVTAGKRPAKASTMPARGGARKVGGPSAMTKPYNVARKWHHATTREKERERISKENRLQKERMAKYKHQASRGSRPSMAAGGGGGTGLTIEIPGQDAAGGRGHKKEPVQDKYSAEALSCLQQEVCRLRERLKLLTAKHARLEAISRRSQHAKASRGPDKGASLGDSLQPGGELGATGPSEGSDPLLSLGVGSFSDEDLGVLEGRNAELVGLYRDLLARRATWQSKAATYRGEWGRSNEGVQRLGQRLEEAERARKCSTADMVGNGRGDSGSDAAKVVALQARASDLRVEIEALRTAKELKLSNGDLVHEVRVLQSGIDQSEEMAAEKRERLQAVVFDRDAFRAKHDTVVNGRLHERLTESVSALQLALLVLSKERQWNILVEDGVQLQVEAGERKLAARAERELAEAKANIGRLEKGGKREAGKESKGE